MTETTTTTIQYARHSERVDLSGRDLMMILGGTKAEVVSALGLELTGAPISTISVPAKKVAALNGEVADEVHEWANATLGSSFRSLSLFFRDESLIAVQWSFSLEDYLPKRTPWYKRWFR